MGADHIQWRQEAPNHPARWPHSGLHDVPGVYLDANVQMNLERHEL